MKRVLALLIALLHLAATTGASVYVHHCMGRKVSTSMQSTDDEQGHHCSHCGMQKKKAGNGCCKDEVHIVKKKADGTLAKVLPDISGPAAIVPAAHYRNPFPAPYTAAASPASYFGDRHGPPGSPLPIWLSIRSLRI